MRLLASLACWFVLSTPVVFAQSIQYEDVIVHDARATTHDGVVVNVNRSNTVRFDVSITGTATVQFHISGPGKYGWYPKICKESGTELLVSETATSGTYVCTVAAGAAMKAPVAAYTSGTISVVARATTAF